MKRVLVPVVIFIAVSFIYGCKKPEKITLSTLFTLPVTNITPTTANSGGNIRADGNAIVTSRGVCWSTLSDPTILDSHTSDSMGLGQFASKITGINPATLYYVRAYATNSAGTAYGDEVSFTSASPQLASLITTPVTLITATTAASGGNISDDGGSSITARGVCWGTEPSPTVSGSHTSDGSGKGVFTSNLIDLSPATHYYVRAYAENGTGTSYGNEVSFTSGQAQAANEVIIQGMAFSPQTITVAVNTTVKWTNNDAISHTVTSDTGLFNSGTLAPAGTFSFQFTAAGTFTYHCSIHTDMTATVIVQ